MPDRRPLHTDPERVLDVLRAVLTDHTPTLDPRLVRQILALAELGLEHPDAKALTREARTRRWIAQVDGMKAHGKSEREACGSVAAGSLTSDAVRKAIQRYRENQVERRGF